MQVNCQLHVPAYLTPAERAPSIDWIAGRVGPQSRPGHGGIENHLLPVPGIELLWSYPYPVAVPTELSRLPLSYMDIQMCSFPHNIGICSTFLFWH
jgi:hypothetical protein